MAFRLEEFKKTTRKGAGDAPAAVYPHQLKDKKILTRLPIAIRTFDGSVGRRRKDMDAQAMTDFFGDPRLARGVVACLGQFYQYATPDFAQAVGRAGAQRLHGAGLLRPADIRATTYAHVNAELGGFVGEAGRAACYGALGKRFCLTAHQWDTLLHLDAEDHQVLTRAGAVPTPADLVALYNFHSLDTVLRRASAITLNGLALTSGDAAEIRALARALDVRAVVGSGGTVTLTEFISEGKMGVAGLFPRRAGRLGRCLLYLIQSYGTRAVTGWADARVGASSFRLALSTDTLRALGMPTKAADEPPHWGRRMEAGSALLKDLRKLRAKGEGGGWRVKRLPDPVVSALGVGLPDFKLTRAQSGTKYLVLGAVSELPAAEGADTVAFPVGRKPLDAKDVLARVNAAADSLFALPAPARPAVPADVLTLCDRAATEGLVRAADARRTLHLLDESPLIEWVRQCADPRVLYIPGVGLCSSAMVSAIQGQDLFAQAAD